MTKKSKDSTKNVIKSQSNESIDTLESESSISSIKKSVNEITWDGQEQASVLECYGLDNLQPTKWVLKEPQIDIITAYSNMGLSTGAGLVRSNTNATNLNSEEIGGAQVETSAAATKTFYLDLLRADKRDPLNLKALSIDPPEPSGDYDPSLVYLNSKCFDPKVFLATVHHSTSFKDLQKGLENLKLIVEKRNETIKLLVKTNFAKFVSSKSTIDAFYKEMKSKNLTEKEDFGTRLYKKELLAALNESQSLFGAMIERRQTARHITVAKSVLEQCKFFFNLPFSLRESLRKRQFASAIRDYKKGKSFMQNYLVKVSNFAVESPVAQPSVEEQLAEGNKKSLDTSFNLNATQLTSTQKAFKSVWEDVGRVAEQLRTELLAKLRDPEINLDEVEQLMIQLYDLDMPSDPSLLVLEIKYMRLLDKFKSRFQLFSANCNIDAVSDVPLTHSYVKSLVEAIKQRRLNELASSNDDVGIWFASTALLSDLRQLVAQFLPKYARIARLCLSGRFSNQKHSNSWEAVNSKFAKDMIRDMLFHLMTVLDLIFGTDSLSLADLDESFKTEFDAATLEALQQPENNGLVVPKISIISSSNNNGSIPEIKESVALDRSTKSATDNLRTLLSMPQTKDLTALKFPTATNGYQLSKGFPSRLLKGNFLIMCFYSIQIVSCLQSILQSFKVLQNLVDAEMLNGLSRQCALVQTTLLEVQTKHTLKACESFYLLEDWSLVSQRQQKEELQTEKIDAASKTPSLEHFGQTAFLKLFYCAYRICCESTWRISLYDFRVLAPSDRSPRNVFGVSPERSNLPGLTLPSLPRSAALGSNKLEFKRSGNVYRAASTYFDRETENLRLDAVKCSVEDRRDFVRQGFTQGLYLFIDGMHYLSLEQSKLNSKTPQNDNRLLVLAANLSDFCTTVLPRLFTMYETLFQYPLGAEALNVMEASSLLDSVVLDTYIKRKYLALDKTLRKALLSDGFDWARAGKPTQIRPYLLSMLLSFVLVQSQVQKVTGLKSELPSRAVTQLLIYVSQSWLRYVRQLDQLSQGGAAQMLMEVQIFEKVMQKNSTPQLEQIFGQIRQSVENIGLQTGMETAPSEEIKRAMSNLTNEALLHTNMLFSCFQKGPVGNSGLKSGLKKF